MNRKRLAILVCVLICIIVFLFLFFVCKHKKEVKSSHLAIRNFYFLPIQITGFHSGIPSIEIGIRNVISEVDVDLGSGSIVGVPNEYLQQIDNKSYIGSTPYYGIRGKRYQCDVYEIPEVDIGIITLYKVEVTVNNPEWEKDATIMDNSDAPSPRNVGKVGWKLFSKLNLLLDCEKSLLAFCDGWETLQKQGYSVEDFIEVPFVLDRDFIEFEAMTADGPLRCVIDTGCTDNILNKDLNGGSNEHMILNPENINKMHFNPENADQMVFDPDAIYETSTFRIGKEDFGPVTFRQIKMPYQIDAFLGMDFLYSRPMFIDFLNRKIYFSKKIEAKD